LSLLGFPTISFGWRSDIPVPLQICIANTFKEHSWSNDISFLDGYNRRLHQPGVTGIAPVGDFFQEWKDVIQKVREAENTNSTALSISK